MHCSDHVPARNIVTGTLEIFRSSELTACISTSTFEVSQDATLEKESKHDTAIGNNDPARTLEAACVHKMTTGALAEIVILRMIVTF